MHRPESSAAAVYARAEEARCGSLGLRPVPSFEFYKCAREEELGCYRAICRVFVMHTKGELTRQQRRILEDLQDELHIPPARATAEWEAASADAVVMGIAVSGVLHRRGDFYDGVKDIQLDSPSNNNNNAQRGMLGYAQDDRATLYMPPTKVARTEQEVGTAGGGSIAGRRGALPKASNATSLKAVEKIGHEILVISSKLLNAIYEDDQETYREALMSKKEKLQALLKDVEGNAGDISGNSSVIYSDNIS
ncbi:ENT domain [Trypanosoma melophagium]|uniref:ENT domain n=1 Tax=Trypanosoma melophagium TaxID=715481 RepID=UPI00351A178D|nr:ENT domain [Trypanosoma melophagium]